MLLLALLALLFVLFLGLMALFGVGGLAVILSTRLLGRPRGLCPTCHGLVPVGDRLCPRCRSVLTWQR